MRACINGEFRDFVEPLSIGALLDALGTPSSGIAVARNDKVIPSAELCTEIVAEGDRIEIIQAVAGG